MRVVVVTPPQPLVSLADAKEHARIDGSDDDDVILAMIAAASARIDGPDAWLGRAIGTQVLELRTDGFDGPLPCPPVTAVQSVRYLDTAGVEQLLAPAGYELVGTDLAAAWGTAWPSYRMGPEAVRVRYTAGYAAVPPAIRAAVLLMIGDLYDNRGTVETGVRAAAVAIPMSTTVESLLSPYRVWS